MNVRKLFMVAMLFVVLATFVVACASAPTATPVPPTVVPTVAAKPTEAPKPTDLPKPTVAPTQPVVAFDVKSVVDKYLSTLPDGFGGIAPAAARDVMTSTKGVIVLDVRESKEVTDNGYIEGSINIPVRTLLKNLDKLPAKDATILLTCQSGHRGSMAMTALQMLGYTNVKNISGGINAWKTANLPLVTTGTPAAPTAGKAPEVDKDLLAALDKWFSVLPDGFLGIAPAATKDAMAATPKAVVFDVREAKEVTDNGYIDGTSNFSIRLLAKNLDKLPTDKTAPVIIYCASGQRGGIGVVALGLLGYTNVKSMSGGFNAWKTAGLAVATK